MSQHNLLGGGTIRTGLNIGIVVALVLATPPVIAASNQSRERAARKACLSGNYAKGIDILSDLFVETQDATYIFNQGRCLEQNQQYKDAIARFQEFLRSNSVPDLTPEDRASAEKHIASCKQNLAEQAGLVPTNPFPVVAAPNQPPQATPPAPVPAPELPSVVITRPQPMPADAHPGSRLRTSGIVVASVGIAALGAGVGFNLLANKGIADMESQKDGYSDERNSEHKTYSTLAWVSYGVGAACLATGTVLYAIGLRAKSRSSDKVAVIPTVGRDHAGAAFVGAFQ